MENRNIPCEERIDKELKERIEEFKEGLKSEDLIEWLNENMYAIIVGRNLSKDIPFNKQFHLKAQRFWCVRVVKKG